MNLFRDPDFVILLMAHGGPESLDEIPDFLRHIRAGKPLSDKFIEEVTDRYRLIGGKSPLRQITESLASKLASSLHLPVYLGMRHWNPFIGQTIQNIKEQGHENVLAICLAPHYSTLSIKAYQNAVNVANTHAEGRLEIEFVQTWNTNEKLVAYHAKQIIEARKTLNNATVSNVHYLFSAHSLPSRVLECGDPYVEELFGTMSAIRKRLKLEEDKCHLVFQSASPSPEPWLEPRLEVKLEELAKKGVKDIIVVPIGFVADHVEILYDLDILAQGQARALGLRLNRTNMPNDSQEMVAILESIVEESASRFSQSVVIQDTERCFA